MAMRDERRKTDITLSHCQQNNHYHDCGYPKKKYGKIQGDGQEFLDRFKSYLGSQISSQSLNEVHIYRLLPKSATKGDLFIFSYIFVFVSSWHQGLQMANEVEVLPIKDKKLTFCCGFWL